MKEIKFKIRILGSYEVCEYANKCQLECIAKTNKYHALLDCYIRGSFLIADGYKTQ